MNKEHQIERAKDLEEIRLQEESPEQPDVFYDIFNKHSFDKAIELLKEQRLNDRDKARINLVSEMLESIKREHRHD